MGQRSKAKILSVFHNFWVKQALELYGNISYVTSRHSSVASSLPWAKTSVIFQYRARGGLCFNFRKVIIYSNSVVYTGFWAWGVPGAMVPLGGGGLFSLEKAKISRFFKLENFQKILKNQWKFYNFLKIFMGILLNF